MKETIRNILFISTIVFMQGCASFGISEAIGLVKTVGMCAYNYYDSHPEVFHVNKDSGTESDASTDAPQE